MVEYIKELVDTMEMCHARRDDELRAKYGDIPDISRLVEGFGEELKGWIRGILLPQSGTSLSSLVPA
jgi:hypothetical protein